MNQISVITEVKNNRPQLSEYQKTQINKGFALNNGKMVQITVGTIGKSRSEQQNKYYWGVVLKLICEHTGYNAEELHELFKYKFLPKTFVKVGDIESEVVKSSKKLKTDEFTEFIEKVRAFASEELQVIIPDPNEIP